MLLYTAIFVSGVVAGVFLSPASQAAVKWSVERVKGWFQ